MIDPDLKWGAIQAARRASQRAAADVHEEMRWGVSSLAAVASIAPLIGVFGTAWGIINSFVGCGCEKSAALAAISASLSLALAPTALSLVVALTAFYCYRYLTSRLENLDLEMQCASAELANRWAYGIERLNPHPRVQ